MVLAHTHARSQNARGLHHIRRLNIHRLNPPSLMRICTPQHVLPRPRQATQHRHRVAHVEAHHFIIHLSDTVPSRVFYMHTHTIVI